MVASKHRDLSCDVSPSFPYVLRDSDYNDRISALVGRCRRMSRTSNSGLLARLRSEPSVSLAHQLSCFWHARFHRQIRIEERPKKIPMFLFFENGKRATTRINRTYGIADGMAAEQESKCSKKTVSARPPKRSLWHLFRIPPDSTEKTGWPWVVTAPGLPQTRTCPH